MDKSGNWEETLRDYLKLLMQKSTDSVISQILSSAIKTALAYFVFLSFFAGTIVVKDLFAANGVFDELTKDYKNALIGTTPIKVEVVKSEADRIKGLSSRKSLKENHGMLFVFPEPGQHSIWMKDMEFAIDIIWLDAGYFVVDYKKNVTPDSYPESFIPSRDSLYVLEVKSGFIEENFTKIGDQFFFY